MRQAEKARRAPQAGRVLGAMKARGIGLTRLARLTGLGRSHLSQVFHGWRGGAQTIWRIVPFMLQDEVAAMGWTGHTVEATRRFEAMRKALQAVEF